VKVAGVGLGIDLVGKNLREIMPLLRRLVGHIPQMSSEGEIQEEADIRNRDMVHTQQVKEGNMKLLHYQRLCSQRDWNWRIQK
jgi:hypothetical protein